MNEHDESEIAPPILSPPDLVAPGRPTRKPLSFWLRRLLVCNPFYLVSAALLLFGLYRVSIDRDFFGGDVAQLAFNLTSLQLYEILLVVTAIFLARRRIWYESTLLTGLENMLMFVPLILVSQAALPSFARACSSGSIVSALPPGTSILPVMAASIAMEREVEIVSAFWSIERHCVMEAGLAVA